jgi:predicted solute-binding protein
LAGFHFGAVMKAKIGIPSTLSCLPLKRWLAGTRSFEIQESSVVEIATLFRKRDLQAAFVSPIEFARGSSEYRILPGFALSARFGIALHFREGLRKIGTMAANPADISEIVLARIVLAEEFETAPPIVPSAGGRLQALLAKTDSVLLTGDSRLRELSRDPHSIDIAEIWSDMVDLPYVYGVLCAREGLFPADALSELTSQDWEALSRDVAEEDIPAELRGEGQIVRVNEFLDECSYALSNEAEEGLMEFLRYAHYHGMIADIPLLQPYSSGSGDIL